MGLSNPLERELMRIRLTLVGMLLAFVFLGGVLYRVQVARSEIYSSNLDRQSIRRVRLPAPRGRIFDRNGRALADNRPSYCIALYVEELRVAGRTENTVERVDALLTDLSVKLDLPRDMSADDVRNHIRRRTPLPFVAWRDVSERTIARWAEQAMGARGIDVSVEPVRVYTREPQVCHVLGYVGKADLSEEPYHYYLSEMEGRAGIERQLNDVLSGSPGGQLIRVDASGFKHDIEKSGRRDPVPGKDVILALDTALQAEAERALTGVRGAVVILDPNNGDVLALASSPGFDCNIFVPGISAADFRALSRDPGHPFVNRATTEVYSPGSVFKPLVALAALESGKLAADHPYLCPGYYQLGGVRFHCWLRTGHGPLAMRKAIEQSCNAYFCQTGMECGYDAIYAMAAQCGLGQRTGIEGRETRGLLPSREWKVQRMKDDWRPGDTCNISIGQGFLSVTPLQMAVMVAAIANGGYVYRPRLVLDVMAEDDGATVLHGVSEQRRGTYRMGELRTRMPWSRDSLAVVRGGMRDVIHAPTGTGKRALIPGVMMAGKTGTAEYGTREDRKKYAWMILFAPYDEPRYALAMVIEDAISGGISAAPRVRGIMESVLAPRAPGLTGAAAQRVEVAGLQEGGAPWN